MASKFVIGTDRRGFRVIQEVPVDGKNGEVEWRKRILSAEELYNDIKINGEYENVGIKDGKIVGTAGALSRFSDKEIQLVVLEEIRNSAGRTLGYKVAQRDGEIFNIKLEDILKFAEREIGKGNTPLINAIFARREDTGTAFIKGYPNKPIKVYTIPNKVNKYAEAEKQRIQAMEESKCTDNREEKLREIYTEEQLEQIRLGEKQGLRVAVYANPKLSAEQMKALRQGMAQGVNVSRLAYNEYGVEEMKFYICELLCKTDISAYLSPEYNVGQLLVLSNACERGISLELLSNPKMTAQEMQEVAERIEKEIWRDGYMPAVIK